MQPSQACYLLAEEEEALRLTAYPDPDTKGDPWTIGYGHTRGVHEGDTCTPDQAKAWLVEDMAAAAAIVNQHFPAITQGQFDALTDFCFNVGPGGPHKDGLVWLKSGEHSTLMKLTLAGRKEAAADQFPLWVHGGSGNVLGGLVRRRNKERALFLS